MSEKAQSNKEQSGKEAVAEQNPDKEVIELKKPIDWEGERVTQLEYREPNGADVRRAAREYYAVTGETVTEENQLDYMYYLLARALSRPVDFIDALKHQDVNDLLGRLNSPT